MSSGGFTAAVLAAVVVGIVLLKYGTLQPCGIVREAARQEAIREGGAAAAIASLLPDGAIDAIVAAKYGRLTPGRCISMLLGQPITRGEQTTATLPRPAPAPVSIPPENGVLPYNIPKTNPKAYEAWHKILPDALRLQDWIYELTGTASPYTTVSLRSIRYLYGWFCKPHDCGANSIAFLMAENGSRAIGLYVRGVKSNAQEIPLGDPSVEELELLRAKIY